MPGGLLVRAWMPAPGRPRSGRGEAMDGEGQALSGPKSMRCRWRVIHRKREPTTGNAIGASNYRI
ncbi:hypothetical protein XAC3607_3650002 [Xanthomonas citri pv. citri]|nr:hypothetical protein XAC3607_3650002 [Xanthomonas citri pv. citri]